MLAEIFTHIDHWPLKQDEKPWALEFQLRDRETGRLMGEYQPTAWYATREEAQSAEARFWAQGPPQVVEVRETKFTIEER